MYSFIKGIVAEKMDNTVVIDNNGVGYMATVSDFTFNGIGELGEEAILYTYLHVREDEMSLYGFGEKLEREVFKKLLMVSGVGPKMAITILSGVSAQDLTVAIAMQQADVLKNIKGVGTKIRERIMLELKEKMDNIDIDVSGITLPISMQIETPVGTAALGVLMDWGVNRSSAQQIIAKVMTEDDTLETLLAKAFQELGR